MIFLGFRTAALSKTGRCSPSLRPLRSREAAAVISEKISGRSAPAAELTPSSIMKKKSFFPLHEAPFGFVRPTLGKSSGSVYQLDHIPPPFRFQSFNTLATPPFFGTLYFSRGVAEALKKIDESWLPRSYYQLTISSPISFISNLYYLPRWEKRISERKSRGPTTAVVFASGPPANFTQY